MSKFALLFLAVFFGGILAALFFSGTAAFMLYQIVYMLNPDDRWWSASIPGLRYSFITVIVMMIALAMHYKEYSEKAPWLKQPALMWLVAILAMYYFMYLFALNLPFHKRFTFDFTKLVIIIFIAYKLVTSEKALHAVLWTYIIGATYVGYLARSVGRNAQGRVEGIGMIDTGGDGNQTAAALVPAAVLLIYYAWMGNKKVKLLCVICGAFVANALILINSRGSFVGGIVGASLFILYMLFSRHQKAGQRMMAIFIIVAGTSGTIYLTDDTFWQRVGTLQADEETGRRGGDGRTAFWVATFPMLRDNPMGLGIGGFSVLSEAYVDPDRTGGYSTANRVPHSSWFQLLGELGWPGPILFGGLLITLFRQSQRAKKYLIQQDRIDAYFHVLVLQAAFLSYIAAASFIDRIRAEMMYWLILFIAIAGNVYYLQIVNTAQNLRRRRRKKPLHRPTNPTSKEEQYS